MTSLSHVTSSSSSSREYRSGSPATKPKPTAPARKGSGAGSLLREQQQQQQQQQKSLIPTKRSSADETGSGRSPVKTYGNVATAAAVSSSSSKVISKSGGGVTTAMTSSNVTQAKSYATQSGKPLIVPQYRECQGFMQCLQSGKVGRGWTS